MPNNPFWEFSVGVYASSSVADFCLLMQDRFGVDVNLLLLGGYLGVRGVSLSNEEISEISELVCEWQQQVIVPLRDARRAAKQFKYFPGSREQDHLNALRDDIKSAELECEKLEQCMLFAWVQAREQWHYSDEKQAIRDNVLRVLQYYEAVAPDDALTSLVSIFSAWNTKEMCGNHVGRSVN